MNKNTIMSYTLILFSFAIIVLFTKDLIFELQANLDEKSAKTRELENKKKEDERLKGIKVKLSKGEQTEEISKYLIDFNEDEILDYIYSMIEDGNSGKSPKSYGIATIKNLTISKGKKNELGFLEANISLSLEVQTEEKLKEILDFFVKDKSKYKFFIDNFSYTKPDSTPVKVTQTSPFLVEIPLKLFYK